VDSWGIYEAINKSDREHEITLLCSSVGDMEIKCVYHFIVDSRTVARPVLFQNRSAVMNMYQVPTLQTDGSKFRDGQIISTAL
jgi:hypothetical protein